MTAAPISRLDEQAALRSIVEGTATETGESFFAALVEKLKQALGTMGAWVATYDPDKRELYALSMRMRDDKLDGFTYRIDGTPCQTAVAERRAVHIPERIVELYRGDPSLARYGAISYMGVPLFGSDGEIIGQLAVLDDKPMPEEPRGIAIFRIFADRAAAELRRLNADRALREREAQLSRLLDSAMDAIVNFDDAFRVALMNPAARRAFHCTQPPESNLNFGDLLTADSRERLSNCIAQLTSRKSPEKSLWIAGGLRAIAANGEQFQAEATLSHYEANHGHWFTLILRNVEERLAAENQIRSLSHEAQYLREELKELQNFELIVGSSNALLQSLHEVVRVASTDTTVLLLGETGTGKELFARALHAASKRSRKPLIKVNCGAIPQNLVESELFGHEKGAFTGATSRREGRFVLADGGTIFLDELGELPLELQPKLLRVLQEGEFEPVGSSRTQRVNVRVVAATNRNLAECVKQGSFREDLYYRLNVFPIKIPPLRERGDDISELAQTFVDKFARKLGRSLSPLSERTLLRLKAYAWPGNVRELENIIERGVIVSDGGVFDIERVLPEAIPPSPPPRVASSDAAKIRTVLELENFERDNILRALETAQWKVAGEHGAAELLQVAPSTLNSRMRALGIRRPTRDD